MTFRLTMTPEFKKHLERDKTPQQKGVILRCLEQLADDPCHPGLRSERIQGAARKVWASRVDSSNRVTWQYGNVGEIVMLYHCTHKDVYGQDR